MDADIHERVRERAHQLWLQEGCPERRGDEHWQRAQCDVLASLDATATRADARVDQPIDADPIPAFVCIEEQIEAQTTSMLVTGTFLDGEPSRTPPTQLPRKGTTLLKAGLRQCRYIISETYSPAICCGAPTSSGSWCEEHRARVLVRVQVKASPRADKGQPSSW